MLLVGSQAIAWCYPGIARADAAWDIWFAEAELPGPAAAAAETAADDAGDKCAVVRNGERTYRLRMVAEGDPRMQFIAANSDRPLLTNDEGWNVQVASPASIALIARAYLYAPRDWHRRIGEYHQLLSKLERPIGNAAERSAYEALRGDLLRRLDFESDSDFNMRMANEEFFKDFKYPWLRVHEHDDLHHATCYDETPLYQTLKHDLGQAYVPKSGFDQLSHRDQIRMVREECYALALERVLIPAADLGVPWSENHGFQHALRRICTTLARGWFRDFAIDHYAEVSAYDTPFLDVYHDAVKSGTLTRKLLQITPEARREWLTDYLGAQARKDREAAIDAIPA